MTPIPRLRLTQVSMDLKKCFEIGQKFRCNPSGLRRTINIDTHDPSDKNAAQIRIYSDNKILG
ncbi:hypothetical protein CIW50_22355 [Tardiphaga sp. P9-11]|nr:hypothetical protein CIW50_22355 [Tardiphaga sp. P9-11]